MRMQPVSIVHATGKHCACNQAMRIGRDQRGGLAVAQSDLGEQELLVTSCKLQAASYELQATSYKLQAASYKATSYLLSSFFY